MDRSLMVEPTAHNGLDASSTLAGPTNSPVLISFRATREEADRIDAAVAFDGKQSRSQWLKGYVMEMVELAEDDMRERVCTVDLSRAPFLAEALLRE